MRSSRKDLSVTRDVLRSLLAQASRIARALKRNSLIMGYRVMTAAVRELERAIRNSSAGKAKRAAAIREFDEKVEVAMEDMRRFEALVENLLAKNRSVMAE